MGLPRKFLGADEDVILHMRTHGKDLVLPVLGLVFLAALTWVSMAFMPPTWAPAGTWVVGVVVGVLFVLMVLVPFLRWRTTTYTLTDRRVITRKGIINKSGHDIPLSRINNVTYDRSLLDRILGCGTLQLTTAAEAPVTLHDVPDVERVHVVMTELLFGDEAGAVAKATEEE
ncbi:PH domain-containing protein [Pseudactinotalea sp.]|uniref:PH domain-containing protein n=1 Tax=Pseudactinotalea sp. TaxID=1926260 RepID=UPI003B3B1EF4